MKSQMLAEKSQMELQVMTERYHEAEARAGEHQRTAQGLTYLYGVMTERCHDAERRADGYHRAQELQGSYDRVMTERWTGF